MDGPIGNFNYSRVSLSKLQCARILKPVGRKKIERLLSEKSCADVGNMVNVAFQLALGNSIQARITKAELTEITSYLRELDETNALAVQPEKVREFLGRFSYLDFPPPYNAPFDLNKLLSWATREAEYVRDSGRRPSPYLSVYLPAVRLYQDLFSTKGGLTRGGRMLQFIASFVGVGRRLIDADIALFGSPAPAILAGLHAVWQHSANSEAIFQQLKRSKLQNTSGRYIQEN